MWNLGNAQALIQCESPMFVGVTNTKYHEVVLEFVVDALL